MPAHPIDFRIQSAAYATEEGLAIFDETARFQRWLDFEAALAEAQGELGIIPEMAARRIRDKAVLRHLDIEAIREEYSRNRNSLTPVLKALRQACGAEAGQFVHYGATTQDALDTGQILAMKEVLAICYRDLREVEDTLVALTAAHRRTPMIGRTHSQQAVPITFGLKTAGWAMEVRRDIERIKSLAVRALAGQCGGAVGNMAALGAQGREVARRTMARLGLGHSPLPWHTARDNMAEIAAALAICTGTCARIANEIFQLGKTEIGEAREGKARGTSAGSSTMPHKRNPVLCERVVVLERQARSLAAVVGEAMIHENERDPRALWSEWLALPQLAIYTLAAIDYTKTITSGLEVFPERMLENLRRHPEAVLSEWLVFALAADMGRAKAREQVDGLLARAAREGDWRRALADTDLPPAILERLEHPEQCTGLSAELAGDAIEAIKAQRATEAAVLFQEEPRP